MIRLFIFILLVSLLVFLQVLDFSIFGVKPNLAMVAIIVAAFFVADIWEGFLLVAIAALILKFSPGFSGEILIFSLITAVAIIVKKYLPWRSIINILFLIITATLLFYVFSAPGLIVSTIFLKEIIYNIIVGFFIFAALNYFISKRYSQP
ncbi:MAG: hypothetical protein V3T98_00620 [Candidatus Paceibacterota bacterium]